MKHCPTCRTTYTDDTLRFCLADGAPLSESGREQPTVVRHTASDTEKTVAMHGGGQVRVDIPPQASTQPQIQALPTSSGGSPGGLLKVLLVVFGLGLFVVVIALIATIAYYNMRAEAPANAVVDAKTPSASPVATRDGNDELRDQIADLQKLLAQQQNSNRPAPNTSINIPAMPSTTTTARVNSPGDGFLALRTLPSSELGDRITKIPHGATISIGACGPVVRPVSRSGRWCQASYGGRSGWVFDAYLVY